MGKSPKDDDAELLALEREFDAAYAAWLSDANVTAPTLAADAVLSDVVERLIAMRTSTLAGLRVKLKVGTALAEAGSTVDDITSILQCSEDEARLYVQQARRKEDS